MAQATLSRFDFGLSSLRRTLAAAAARASRLYPLGLATGMRAYRVYSDLSQRSDAQLEAMGLTQADLVQEAMRAAERR